MSANHDLDRRIANHFAAEAPPRSPDWVLERILASVNTTPQRRTVLGRPWRIPTMPSTFAKLGLTATVVAVIGVVALALPRQPAVGPGAAAPPASPSPSPSARHAFRPGEARFMSTIHGISIDHPSGWQIRPATAPWTGGRLNFDSPAADVIFDPTLGDRLYLVVASQPLRGVSDDAWRKERIRSLCAGSKGISGGSATVDGAHAWEFTCGSTQNATLIYTDTRGYLIQFVVSSDEPGLAETYDWRWQKAMLETVDLRP